jgi:hypothetical protein
VLLGYFSLLPAISKRVQEKQAIAADEDGHNPQAGLTERLERLVSKLAGLKGFGE